jgi:hypothetical protein
MLVASMWITRSDLRGVWGAARWPLIVSCGLMAALYGVLAQRLGRRTPGAVVVDFITGPGGRPSPRLR